MPRTETIASLRSKLNSIGNNMALLEAVKSNNNSILTGPTLAPSNADSNQNNSNNPQNNRKTPPAKFISVAVPTVSITQPAEVQPTQEPSSSTSQATFTSNKDNNNNQIPGRTGLSSFSSLRKNLQNISPYRHPADEATNLSNANVVPSNDEPKSSTNNNSSSTSSSSSSSSSTTSSAASDETNKTSSIRIPPLQSTLMVGSLPNVNSASVESTVDANAEKCVSHLSVSLVPGQLESNGQKRSAAVSPQGVNAEEKSRNEVSKEVKLSAKEEDVPKTEPPNAGPSLLVVRGT